MAQILQVMRRASGVETSSDVGLTCLLRDTGNKDVCREGTQTRCLMHWCVEQQHKRRLHVPSVILQGPQAEVPWMQGVSNNYDTDLILPIILEAARLAGIEYQSADDKAQTALRVIGDHTRAVRLAARLCG